MSLAPRGRLDLGRHGRQPLFRHAGLRRRDHRHGGFGLHGLGSGGDVGARFCWCGCRANPRGSARSWTRWWPMGGPATFAGQLELWDTSADGRYGDGGCRTASPIGVVMMLDIETFDNLRGGNVAYKALAHPLAAERLARLGRPRRGRSRFSILTGSPGRCWPCARISTSQGVYVQDTLALGKVRGGHIARALTDLPHAQVQSVLVAAFDGRADRGSGWRRSHAGRARGADAG